MDKRITKRKSGNWLLPTPGRFLFDFLLQTNKDFRMEERINRDNQILRCSKQRKADSGIYAMHQALDSDGSTENAIIVRKNRSLQSKTAVFVVRVARLELAASWTQSSVETYT